ncbi:DegQ family serine endoprotease [Biformimicrobium ophioploci]|uniref:Probable periplasmic serine endoprotease DegP-like n=1 Tax=Biformimicrobium ophioploci TaxID=3036711 RepID=A0ABQ6LZR8_9GAMM|nr:DegQ family serine endoprotease [Microbulbifer sp. NKW57]GMG87595.1 serine protease MucD [Microbulbifer sp. NKW57]
MVKRFTQVLVLLWLGIASVAYADLPNFADLVEKNSSAVVKISTVDKGQSSLSDRLPPQFQDIPDIFRHLLEPRRRQDRPVASMGSGFVVSKDGYVVTNNHVIDGADEITVRLSDRREYNAKVIGVDVLSDLALLKIEADDLTVIEWGDSDELRAGEWVLAIGSPFGLDYSASAGIISAMGRSIPSRRSENYVPFIQSDVAINPGNSGGPLFNLEGEVIGINSQIFTRSGGSNGLSFAIPSSLAINVIEQLKGKGRVDRGWLGVGIQDVTRDLAEAMGLRKPHGALVAQVEPGSPAAEAGLLDGDIVIRFDGKKIDESGDLPHVVGQIMPGTEVEMTIVRKGKKDKLDVVVGTLGAADGEVAENRPEPSAVGGRLGVMVTPIPDSIKQRWNIKDGVMVKQVVPGKPAAKAGLRSGDVIAQVGFDAVNDVESFEKVVDGLPANELLPIRFFRGGRPAFRTIQIEE